MQLFTSRFHLSIVSLGVLLSGAIAVAGLSNPVSAVVDNDPDCDTVAIIRCGAFSVGGLREKASRDDVPRVYKAFGIEQNELNGFVDGIVWRDGRVTVDGKVVATNAMTAGRNYGGTPIPNTNGAGKYSTSKFVTEGQTAFVKMVNGTFDFAVIKSCGNPVSATPQTPPEPEPVMIKVCDLKTWKIITIEKSKFDADKHTKNLEKCQPIKVCLLETKEIIKIKKGEFDKTKHSKDLNDCKTPVTPVTPQSPIKVCELATKNIIEIKPTEFDSAKHSKDLNDCKEAEETVQTPATIADTGPEALLGGIFGSSALGYGGYSYLQSRRHLLSKFLNR